MDTKLKENKRTFIICHTVSIHCILMLSYKLQGAESLRS